MAKKQAHLPLDAGMERCETVSIELTDSERIEFRKAAERCGLSLSEWIRDRLNEALKREAKEA